MYKFESMGMKSQSRPKPFCGSTVLSISNDRISIHVSMAPYLMGASSLKGHIELTDPVVVFEAFKIGLSTFAIELLFPRARGGWCTDHPNPVGPFNRVVFKSL